MNDNIKDFLEKVKQNPDLPVIPMVEIDLSSDEFRYSWGGFGLCEVTECCQYEVSGEVHLFTRDDQDEIEEYMTDKIVDYDEYSKLSAKELDKVVHEKVEALAWTKAIIVYITA